jgi:hypothetical protein
MSDSKEGVLPVGYKVKDFKSWFKKNMGFEFNSSEIKDSTIAPGMGQGSTIINKLAAITSRSRDEHIVEVTRNALLDYKNVLIIYGAGHLVMQRLTLEKMLGPSKSRKLF